MTTEGRPRAAIVTLGRSAGGELRRVATWQEVLRAAGFEPHVTLTLERRRRPPSLPSIIDVARGKAVPESLLWNARRVTKHLQGLAPELIVCVTARSYSPMFTSLDIPMVLDFVDQLSVSYDQRARRSSFGLRLVLRALKRRMAGFEALELDVHRFAAGVADARVLRAHWLPITIPLHSPPDTGPTGSSSDVIFFGSLSYAPNVEALEELAHAWPAVLEARLQTSLCIAGRGADKNVTRLAAEHGWRMHGPYIDIDALVGLGTVAVAPLRSSTGIQNKILEAAAIGLPQIAYPAALRGFDPQPPVLVVDDADALARAIVELLGDADGRVLLSGSGQAWAREHFSATAWATRFLDVLTGTTAPSEHADARQRTKQVRRRSNLPG